MPVGFSSHPEHNSLYLLSLDALIENRPDLIPAVDIYGRPWDVEWAEGPEPSDFPPVVSLLSPERQALLHAIYVRGMSNREYAALKGVNESSVRRQRARTIATLKRLLDV